MMITRQAAACPFLIPTTKQSTKMKMFKKIVNVTIKLSLWDFQSR